jgi:hypothetical protein
MNYEQNTHMHSTLPSDMCGCPAQLLNLLNAELNPICQLLALLAAYPVLHISRIRDKL